MRQAPIPFLLFAGALSAPAQGLVAQNPDPHSHSEEHADHSTTGFDPAIGAVIDFSTSWLEAGDEEADDGLDFDLRAFELSTNAWIDADTWAYVVLLGSEEEVGLEEAAVDYYGFGANSKLRTGRFFVDFGRQMQRHVHELDYPDRPAVLRAYLGSELSGTGLQYGHSFATGEESRLSFSIGVFDSLVGHDHEDESDEHDGEELAGAEPSVADHNQADEVALTARVTGESHLNEHSSLQWGLSARHIPEFAFVAEDEEGEELSAQGLDNTVFGVDFTYEWTGETGAGGWSFGAEYLRYLGDIGADVREEGDELELELIDDEVSGYYAWLDRKWSSRDATGVLYSSFEHAEAESPGESELTVYWTRHLSDFSRVRLALTHIDREEGEDDQRLMLQFTNFLGTHGHGPGGE